MENRSNKPKEDQRIRLTKGMLKTAFIQLLQEKPIQNISVKELCERAGVNRGTFYSHYYDLYDLLESLENEMIFDLQQLLSENPVIEQSLTQEQSMEFVTALFGFVEKNKEMCAILLGDNGDKKFVAKLIELGREKSVTEYRAVFPGTSEQQAEVFYAFVAWGFIGLIRYGLENPGTSFKELIAAAEKIVTESTRYLASE